MSYSTGKPLFSTAAKFGLADDAKQKNANQYFSLVRDVGAKTPGSNDVFSGPFLFKAKESQEFLFANGKVSTKQGTGGGAHYYQDECYFLLYPGKFGFQSMFRLVSLAGDGPRVISVPSGGTSVVDQAFSILNEIDSDQYFWFDYEDMKLDRIVYEPAALGQPPSGKVVLGATQYFFNNGPATQTQKIEYTEVLSNTNSFQYTGGLMYSETFEASGGLPVVANGKVVVGSTQSVGWTLGTVQMVDETHNVQISLNIPPYTNASAVVTISVGKAEVPYILYLSSKLTGTRAQSKGIYRGSTGWDTTVIYGKVSPFARLVEPWECRRDTPNPIPLAANTRPTD
ncbi:hypothetical protein B0H16DRAFT_1837454 [Mycena metata]|uniref:Uncharacterized protein n=1 Tax=Mycena metata TaxID=1033252 RepID=A0AAD7J155_9AGAR|nr:hypothetical protein B0H16DRAFT_1837454 [Mycena metata]